MPWLEMSRDVAHGGPGWEFGTCLWSPTERNGGGRWGYWDLMQRVCKGDVVLHLRSKTKPHFVGHSVADTNCYITGQRPPQAGAWDHAIKFYRVPLRDYCPFEKPIPLTVIFEKYFDQLTHYHENHSPVSGPNGRFLFYVPQSGRLQCQNGAYLSEIDEELNSIIFGNGAVNMTSNQVATGSGIATLHTRIGQHSFSEAVRKNFGSKCCFPGCKVVDESFLIGAHIARWSDSIDQRGRVENGLCFCLMHDKAFEVGLFVIDEDLRIIPTIFAKETCWAQTNVIPFENQTIVIGLIRPSLQCLQMHWQRVGYTPPA